MNAADITPCVRLIRRAMDDDEARQARQTFRFHFACRRHGLDDGRAYYVLDADATICGLAGLHHYHWGPPENVWLAWFAVDPARQGRGLGTLLLEAMTHEARRRGYTKFFVETYSTPQFARARAFYRAHGFIQAGRVRSYLAADAGDMIVFFKILSQALHVQQSQESRGFHPFLAGPAGVAGDRQLAQQCGHAAHGGRAASGRELGDSF